MELIRGIAAAYEERRDLMVLALTGRTGSGCTTAASQLSKPFQEISLTYEDSPEPEKRKLAISQDFAKAQWVPFKCISVSSAIYSFLLEEPWESIEKLIRAHKISEQSISNLMQLHETLRTHANYASFSAAMNSSSDDDTKSKAWEFFSVDISQKLIEVRREFGNSFQPFFQIIGDNVRLSGKATNLEADASKLFSLMLRLRKLVHAAESHNKANKITSTRVVIDAIRNPLELVYLRDHFGSFYAVAITTDDEARRARLADGGLSKADITKLDDKEYSSTTKHLDDYKSFVSQNLMDCIQKADIFIHNPGKPGEIGLLGKYLNTQLIRYVALALRPGLVTPTRDERCMQIAFVAKLNSGCISRQVGAAVADKNYSIKSVGWNDVAKGQVPCLLRNVDDLIKGDDSNAFSDYEKKSQDLKSYLSKTFKQRETLKASQGLRCPYCFKDAYNAITKKSNQVHTRSLHAEENAFLQLAKYGSNGIEHGVLYTTASPCELCSKKAYQLGIKEIVFVDPYPGISSTHVLAYGADEDRPKLRLFSGAVGHAYHRLYDPLLSIKDEYAARLSQEPQIQLPLASPKT